MKLNLERRVHLKDKDDRDKTVLFRVAANNPGDVVDLLRSDLVVVNIQEVCLVIFQWCY